MTPSTDIALAIFIDHYNGEINKVLSQLEFIRSVGIPPTEESTSNINEKLYKLIMYRKNISDIINNREHNQITN